MATGDSHSSTAIHTHSYTAIHTQLHTTATYSHNKRPSHGVHDHTHTHTHGHSDAHVFGGHCQLGRDLLENRNHPVLTNTYLVLPAVAHTALLTSLIATANFVGTCLMPVAILVAGCLASMAMVASSCFLVGIFSQAFNCE